jgi:hypothetical protein
MATKKIPRGRFPWIVLGIMTSIGLAGCGAKRLPVAGSVTLDGKPVSGVVLTFSPNAAKGNTASISCSGPVTDGRYELRTIAITNANSGSGVPPGWYKVIVRVPDVKAKKLSLVKASIPDKYLSLEKTPLEVEVKDNPEPGAYDFHLQK